VHGTDKLRFLSVTGIRTLGFGRRRLSLGKADRTAAVRLAFPSDTWASY